MDPTSQPAVSSESARPLVLSESPRQEGQTHDTQNAHSRNRKSTGASAVSRPSFTLQRVKTTMFKPERKVGPAPTFWRSIKSIILSSWINVLLVFIPVSWALNFATPDKHTLIFVCTSAFALLGVLSRQADWRQVSFLAIIPLAKLLAFATDELSMRVGQTLAGLINATLGNAVELIVAIIALTHCQLGIVQSSLVGSILSNLLLVLGMCFAAGGLKFSEQGFGSVATQLNSSLLTISVIAVLLPAAFHMNVTPQSDNDESQDILKMSHGVAIMLLLIYVGYLVFQLYSHATLYSDKEDAVKSIRYPPRSSKKQEDKEANSPVNGTMGNSTTPAPDTNDVEEEEEEPQTSLPIAIALLVVVTVLVAVTAEWLVDSIDGLTLSGNISREFVGVILLPIVGNAAEHVTAVTVSVKDKLTLSLGVAVGSSIQIALFVIPFMVILGWIIGKPLTLLFDPYESVTLFLAVITVNYCVQDGKSNWLEGLILMFLYVILGITFWFYPGLPPEQRLNLQCS